MGENQVLRIDQLTKLLGISKSTVYLWSCPQSPQFDPTFPKRIRLGRRSVGWMLKDVNAWLENKRNQNSVNH